MFPPRDALALAGADVSGLPAWQPNVVRDRDLLTGQNPASDAMLVELALKALAEQAAAALRR